jgi:hypothetical protein
MNIEKAIKIIEDNANSDNNSLLEFTHEKSCFDENAFWKYYNAIRQIGIEFTINKQLPRDLVIKLIKGYEYFLLQIGFHFDKNDGYEMINLPDNYTEYCRRLRVAVDAFMTGEPITDEDENYLNENLKNIE